MRVRLNGRDRVRVASRATVSETSVRRYDAGVEVHPNTRARIERALHELKLDHALQNGAAA
jgi:hypothetical protein